jgi:hypothetical protein
MKTLVRISSVTIPSGTMEQTISLDIHSVRSDLVTAAKRHENDITLELDVEAERSPEVFYEVYLSAPKGTRYSVGNIALYGAGIRSEAHGEFHPAHVQLFVSKAIAAALTRPSTRTLNITFVTRGAEGMPPARSAASLTIVRGEIAVGPRQRE